MPSQTAAVGEADGVWTISCMTISCLFILRGGMPRRDVVLGHARAAEAPGPRRSWAGVGAESRRSWCGRSRWRRLGGPARDRGDEPRFGVGLRGARRSAPVQVRAIGGTQGGASWQRRWVLSTARRAAGERRPDTPAPRYRGRRASREVFVSTDKRSSRSATFTARPSPSWARTERSGGPRRVAEASTCGTMRDHDGVSIHGCPPLFLWQAERAEERQRTEATGIEA